MNDVFMTGIKIQKVRHLKDINIPLSKSERKHLVLTGKNGSGKTSVITCLANHLEYITSSNFLLEEEIKKQLSYWDSNVLNGSNLSEKGMREKEKNQKNKEFYEKKLEAWTRGCTAEYTSLLKLREKYFAGKFVLAYYGDTRKINVSVYKNIEKVDLKSTYTLNESPSKDLGKYLVNLKSTQAFAQQKKEMTRANEIDIWFERFENILKRIYDDDSLRLDFNIDTFQFSILINGREPFSFNTMSMGYAAIFDIIADLIMRMEHQKCYNLEGIVLIDEIETHLHVELQKMIVPILVELFPNIQFVLTTHSPFILNSTPNAVVYDLEKHLLATDGLTDLPYEGIVEGYFDADLLSQNLRNKFEEYKELIQHQVLQDDDYAKLYELEYYLNEIPDYLAIDFAEEYSRLKTEFHSRG